MFRSFKIAVVAVSLLVGGTALADHQKDGKAGSGHERRAKRMARFDLDNDGKLDKAERAAMMKAKFDRLDRNGDGVLSFAEARRTLERGSSAKRGQRGARNGRRAGHDRSPADRGHRSHKAE